MIYSIQLKNYYSIKDEVFVDFTVDLNAPKNNKYYADHNDTRLSSVSTLVGANSSGKTTLLRAIVFLRWIIADSFGDNKHIGRLYEPFAATKKQPTELEVTFGVAHNIYEYTVHIQKDRIILENLSQRSKTKVRTTTKLLFSRKWQSEKKSYVLSDKGSIFKTPFTESQSDKLAKVSCISVADYFGDSVPSEIAKYWRNMESNIDLDRFPFSYGPFESYHAIDNLSKVGENYCFDLISKYDLSIKGVDAKKGEIVHTHGKETFRIDIKDESSGTRQFFVLADKLQRVLAKGGVALIDEFDAYLHPFMLNELVTQFFDPTKNKKGAQLLMSTHSHQILTMLDKYQIFIVEKNDNVTDISRLDTFPNVRADDNYFAKYMSGKYGGVPVID